MAMDERTLREAVTSLYEDTPDAVVLYDRGGSVIAANSSAALLVGYSEDELVGRSYRDQIRKLDEDRVALAFQTALDGGFDQFDLTVRHKDGSIVPVEVYMFPARFGDAIVGVFAQARDLVAFRSAEESLTANQQKFRSLFEYHPDGIMELKPGGLISRVNVALESETGFFGEQIVGKPWTDLIAPAERDVADEALRAAVRGEATELDSLMLDRLGNRIDVQLKLVPLHVGDEVRGAYAIFKNVAAQKNAERAIEVQSERIRRLYLVAASRSESIDDQINATLQLGLELFGFDEGYVTHFERDHVTIRNAVGGGPITRGAIFSTERSLSRHLRGERSLLVIPDMDAPEWRHDPARETAPWRSYIGIRLQTGSNVFGALVFASRMPHPEGVDPRERDLLQLMGLFILAALERAQQNERIEQLAFNDALTGLPNRVLFSDRIKNTLATSKRYNRGFAVMYADVDKFKDINDQYGHAVGDAVLVEVAKRLSEALRESDTVARFGGDEFVILQPIVDGSSDAADLARKLNFALQTPVEINGVAHNVHASIGIALYPQDATTIDDLMQAADSALYRAKREGRNRWCFADQELARRQFGQRLRPERREDRLSG
jgi:diguanylate cyclase (GGDEF)-like protein/PAS domain S-box-containing protein